VCILTAQVGPLGTMNDDALNLGNPDPLKKIKVLGALVGLSSLNDNSNSYNLKTTEPIMMKYMQEISTINWPIVCAGPTAPQQSGNGKGRPS